MRKALLAVVALLAGPLSALAPQVAHAGSPSNAGMPDQTSLDTADPNNANWPSLEGGVSARPYVTALSVINNGVSTPVITNGAAAAETNVPAGRIAVAIAPFNLCRAGQTPAQGVCYATPNRIGVTVGYQMGPGQLGYDFTSPKGQNNQPLTLATPVTADTEFDITLNLNTLGKTLRWTWANGVVSYWNTANLGTDAATLRIRVKPALSPIVLQGSQQVGCTQVPVQTCQYTQNTHETLTANVVLSLDTTLDEVFTGALFASSRSFMGSLMSVPGDSPKLSYGISAPLTWSDGTPNKTTMSAVLSDAAILNFFGATPAVAATPEFTDAAFSLARTDGGSQGTPTWTRWTADAQGTDGWLVTIPDITFAAAVTSSGVRSAAAGVAPATFKVNSKTAATVSRKKSGKATLLTLRVKAAACAKASCRVVVSSISSKTGNSAKTVKTATVLRKSKSVTATVSASSGTNQRLTAMLQTKKAGKWVYVASAVSSP
ncbi:MAG: hypothetical protein FJW53_07985 [Actinobacteria bacterium]|nr:hypothetical protein [Actinomycetota bacterium]